MLACISEGRNPADEEETVYRRGVTGACKLTHAEISNIMQTHKQRDLNNMDSHSESSATISTSHTNIHDKRMERQH